MSAQPIPSPSASAAPMPPLPDLPGGPQGPQGGAAGPGGFMTQLMTGLAPVKQSVDAIQTECQKMALSGLVPPQTIAQIVALTSALLPAAATAAIGGPGQSGMPSAPPGLPMPMGQGPQPPQGGPQGQ